MSRKVTELIKTNKNISFSFEVTPEVNEDELNNLELNPTFFSITWHAQKHECKNLSIAPLNLARFLRNKGKNVLLHLSCTLIKKEYLERLLSFLQNEDICNIFVILGENFDANNSDFNNSQELISYVRQATGNYFCIGVAGFPGCDDNKLEALKRKVDSGVDFILTQAFFDYSIYKEYLEKCKHMGINVPIIPSIFPFETKCELVKFVDLCKVRVNYTYIDKISNASTGIEITQELMDKLIASNRANTNHIHFFTLNKFGRMSKLLKKYT